MTGPLVIGHRGASGYRPEHSASAYRLAWRSGADSVEPDVLATRDGVLVCRHDLDLDRTTDVAQRPEFASRRRSMLLDGVTVHGWFVHDFDLAEIRQLRVRERWPQQRPTSARYDGQTGVLTLEELLRLRAAESRLAGRQLGMHIELKHPELFSGLGRGLHEPLVDLLARYRLTSALSGTTVMSFDEGVLRWLRRRIDTELVQLVDRQDVVSRRRFHRVSSYATAVGVHKVHALPRTVTEAARAGLEVLVWTLREQDLSEVGRVLDLGVDGVLTDFPDVAAAARDLRRASTAA